MRNVCKNRLVGLLVIFVGLNLLTNRGIVVFHGIACLGGLVLDVARNFKSNQVTSWVERLCHIHLDFAEHS